MFKRVLPIFILIVLVLIMLIFLPVYGESSLDSPQQTWPSRTPTSNAPPNPTKPPPGEGTSEPPTAESSPPALPTSTDNAATQPAMIFLPTAAPCQVPPTAMALGTVAVRTGPGIAYDQIGLMAFSEVRTVVGRTQYIPWWQIQFTADLTGWVAAEAVDVQGYTADVGIMVPPLLDGKTPEAGPEWEPTADPMCIMTFNAAGASPPPTQVTQEPTETLEADLIPAATEERTEASVTAQPATEEEVEAPEVREDSEVSELPDIDQTSSLETGSYLNWVLGAGLLLIVAAIVIYLIQRRSN